MNEKEVKTRGVKAGVKRGSYKKTAQPRSQYTIILSDAERDKLNDLRGDLSMSAYIRKALKLSE